jgi:spore maturation protein SpmB
MIMNIAANVLGLGNAATPFGIRAMQELETLNKHPGTATNAMVLFLAINTSGVAVLPTGVMAMRASLKSVHPEDVFIPTLVASALNTLVAVGAAKLFQRVFPAPEAAEEKPTAVEWKEYLPLGVGLSVMLGLVWAVWSYGDRAGNWIIPGLIGGMLSFGVIRKVKVYEVFVEGARDGFNSATRIIPYMVAILVAVGMFRASGAMKLLTDILGTPASYLKIPPEVLPLALLRPLSGSGAYALTGELTKTHGPDSLVGVIAGTMQGTTETTFYVLSVYFGAIGISKSRHAVLTGICSDTSGVLAAVWTVLLLASYGSLSHLLH